MPECDKLIPSLKQALIVYAAVVEIIESLTATPLTDEERE